MQCHRDLHVGLLATADGYFGGLVDCDKPRPEIQRRDATVAFDDRYLDGRPWPQRWTQQLCLIDLVELTNNLANAHVDGHTDYEQRARPGPSTVLTECAT